jgi:hypothetical protein
VLLRRPVGIRLSLGSSGIMLVSIATFLGELDYCKACKACKAGDFMKLPSQRGF